MEDSNLQPAGYTEVWGARIRTVNKKFRGRVPDGDRTRNPLDHRRGNRMNVADWDRLTCREIAHEVVAWLRHDGVIGALPLRQGLALRGPAADGRWREGRRIPLGAGRLRRLGGTAGFEGEHR